MRCSVSVREQRLIKGPEGVLTKPDIIGGSTARDNWVKVLQGKEHVLKHGYYCVRLPDDDERRRNLSRASSQQASIDFFLRTSPWAQFTGADRHRLGIPGFISDVSRLLISMTERASVFLYKESILLPY